MSLLKNMGNLINTGGKSINKAEPAQEDIDKANKNRLEYNILSSKKKLSEKEVSNLKVVAVLRSPIEDGRVAIKISKGKREQVGALIGYEVVNINNNVDSVQIPILRMDGTIEMLNMKYSEHGIISNDALTAFCNKKYKEMMQVLSSGNNVGLNNQLSNLDRLSIESDLGISNYNLIRASNKADRYRLAAKKEEAYIEATQEREINRAENVLGKPFEFWFAAEHMRHEESEIRRARMKTNRSAAKNEREELERYDCLTRLKVYRNYNIESTIGYILKNNSSKTAQIPILDDYKDFILRDVNPGELTILSMKALTLYVNSMLNKYPEEDKGTGIVMRIGRDLGLKDRVRINDNRICNLSVLHTIEEKTVDSTNRLLGKPFGCWFGDEARGSREKDLKNQYSVFVSAILIKNGERCAFNVKNMGPDIVINSEVFKAQAEVILNKEQMLLLEDTGVSFLNATVYKNYLGTIIVKSLPGKNIPEVSAY